MAFNIFPPGFEYDSAFQREVLERARFGVDRYDPAQLQEHMQGYPGFDFSHPVPVEYGGGGSGIPVKEFEPLVYRCIRRIVADENAEKDVAWMTKGMDTLKVLLEAGASAASRNHQGLSSLDLMCMLMSHHRWRNTHKQRQAVEGILMDAMDLIFSTGIDINAPSRTTQIAALLMDHDTPRKAMEALIANPPNDSTAAFLRSRLMEMDVNKPDQPGMGSPRTRF